MSIQILMPALSPTMEEGALAKWLVKPGDKIEPGQVIAEIETDKAVMEVEAVDEGVVESILVAEGAQGVKVNTPIATLRGEGETAAPSQAKAPASPSVGKAAPQAREEDRGATTASSVPAPTGQLPHRGGAGAQHAAGERVAASPLAKRMAQLAGIDLSGLVGSGPHGRVVKRDIEAVMEKRPLADNRALTVPASSPPALTKVRTLAEMGIADGTYRLVPLDMMRKTIARRMTESFRDIPHFPLTIDLDIDQLLKARADINKRFGDSGVKVSVNDFVIRASALALSRVPESNASYTPDGIALHNHADVAVAVAIEGGLITPIIRAAETKGLAQISEEMRDLAKRAKEKRLKPEEYQGGTFSVSNLGMFNIKSFASIINEPQGMIMSVGAGEKRPVVKNDALAIATMMTVTLTCDHRVVDGAIGSAFLKAFRGFIEDPMAMLL
jgi:pyruvate dehydrogenase E2 component (dihydrolipoyllysine-residue acetyltransferase)